MSITLVIDDAIGERRRVLLDGEGRPFRLDLDRWSERETRARVGETWRGLVRARLPGGQGWFVDLGPGGQGLVEPGKAIDHAEGRWLTLKVKTEATRQKGAVLVATDPSGPEPAPQKQGRWKPAEQDAFLHGVDVTREITGREARDIVTAALEEAVLPVAPLPGGGNIAIEATRGLAAIDVDGADRRSGPAFALELNREAAEEAARQMSLRGIGGLVVVDFVRMRETIQRREITETFRNALRQRLQRRVEVLEISALGLTEASLPRFLCGAADALAMTPPEEREALAALAEIQRMGEEARGARIRARLSRSAAAWLNQNHIDWTKALADRIGHRWVLEPTEAAPGQPSVSVDTHSPQGGDS